MWMLDAAWVASDFFAVFCKFPAVDGFPCPSLSFLIYLLLSGYVGISIQVFFEFSAKTLLNVLQTDCVGVFSEVWGVSLGGRPSNGNVVFKLDHEGVDEGGTRLFRLLRPERS